MRGESKQLALPSNSYAPKGPVNAKDTAGVGVHAAGVGPQTPAGSYANAAIRSLAVLQVLQLLQDELENCGEMELEEVLRIINWGAQIPNWSVTTWIRSSASLLLHEYYSIDIMDGGFCVESRAGDFCVESVGNVFWALTPACHYQITFHRPELPGMWEYLLFNPFMCVQFTLCVWVWKEGNGGFQIERNSHSMGITMPAGLAVLKV